MSEKRPPNWSLAWEGWDEGQKQPGARGQMQTPPCPGPLSLGSTPAGR